MTYINFPIVWARRIQTEIELSTTEEGYIVIYQSIRVVLTFVGLIKKIDFALELQCETPNFLCSLFKKLVTVNEHNQGVIALAVSPQMRPHTKHIVIKYHQF